MKETIRRIRQMELYFDMVNQALNIDMHFAKSDTHIISMINILTDYMESGQWQKDYEADERGELPRDLKRGVLSQDGLYDLLERTKDVK